VKQLHLKKESSEQHQQHNQKKRKKEQKQHENPDHPYKGKKIDFFWLREDVYDYNIPIDKFTTPCSSFLFYHRFIYKIFNY
jgi:hypothetical protein